MKYNRQNEIIALISELEIETQEELSEQLRRRGYMVTQATISRDIRELKLVKVAGAGGKYKYALPHHEETRDKLEVLQFACRDADRVDSANNIVVVKTCAGMAQGAGAAIDSMGRERHRRQRCRRRYYYYSHAHQRGGDDTRLRAARDNRKMTTPDLIFGQILIGRRKGGVYAAKSAY